MRRGDARRWWRGLPLALWLAAVPGLRAQPLAPAPTPPDAGMRPALDAALPPDLAFTDSTGHAVMLREALGDRPVLLVLGYYRCPQLCGLLMHGLLEALHDSRLPRTAYRVLRVSIDPAETPADARARRSADLAYAQLLQGPRTPVPPLDLRLLTGPPASLQAVAQRVGYRFQRSERRADDGAAFAHPAVVVVVTPGGRVSGYLNGIRFDPGELRLALVQAGEGRIGTVGDRLALLCAHFDPRLGRHSAAVLRGMQVLGGGLVLALALLWWRQAGRRRRGR